MRLVHACPLKVEIVFITVTDWVAIMTRCIHQPDPTLASTKVDWVLLARKPTAVTEMVSLGGSQLLKPLLQQGWVLFQWKLITVALAHLFFRVK